MLTYSPVAQWACMILNFPTSALHFYSMKEVPHRYERWMTSNVLGNSQIRFRESVDP